MVVYVDDVMNYYVDNQTKY